MRLALTVLDEDLVIWCEEHERRRLEDLASALNARLASFTGEAEGMRRLVLTALALLDETQTTNAALARARCEIERLTDMVVEAKLESAGAGGDSADRGRVRALRVAEGTA